ncbi:SAV_915 family protein [Micromonospora sp. IBHARD004]|uniref:SAV_915 family protein n=1 Tax=Micromonospora sp. IBHARD004 TaxID=3457764 RepID=UPI004059FCDF
MSPRTADRGAALTGAVGAVTPAGGEPAGASKARCDWPQRREDRVHDRPLALPAAVASDRRRRSGGPSWKDSAPHGRGTKKLRRPSTCRARTGVADAADRSATLGRRVGIAFTRPERLVTAMGENQRWLRLSESALRAMLAPLGIDRIQVDALLVAPGLGPDLTAAVPAPPAARVARAARRRIGRRPGRTRHPVPVR